MCLFYVFVARYKYMNDSPLFYEVNLSELMLNLWRVKFLCVVVCCFPVYEMHEVIKTGQKLQSFVIQKVI